MNHNIIDLLTNIIIIIMVCWVWWLYEKTRELIDTMTVMRKLFNAIDKNEFHGRYLKNSETEKEVKNR